MAVNKTRQFDNLVMVESLKSLQSLGGSVSRKEIKQEIRDHSATITEEQVDEIKVSKRTGNQYPAFDFPFNFAIAHLKLAGFVEEDDARHISLSERGRSIDFNTFDPEQDVWPIVNELEKINPSKKKEIDDDREEIDEEPWRLELKAALKKMSPRKFEMFCRGLLKNMNIDVDDTLGIAYVGDGGIDGYGYYESEFDFRTERVALQAKRWENKVSAPDIDKFRGAMDKYNADYGLFITTSDFTREAINASRAGSHVITLINGDRICDLVAKYNYYVEPVTTYRLKDFYTDDK